MKPDVSGMLRMLFIFFFFSSSISLFPPLLSSCAAFKINVALKGGEGDEKDGGIKSEMSS